MSLTARQPQRAPRGADVASPASRSEPAEVRFDPRLAERLRAASRPKTPPAAMLAERPAPRRETYSYD